MIKKMKAHAGSDTHIRYVEDELLAKKGESNSHHLQRVGDHERRTEILPSHFFAVLISYANKQHIPTQQTSIC